MNKKLGYSPLFILISSLLIVTLLANGYTNVTVSEAKTMIDSNPSLVVLDVRTQSEYDSGHIRNAKLIPVNELEGRLDELNKTDEILVYCGSGGRSATASQILANNSFLYVYNMLGGITAWINEGYPVYVKYSSIQEVINNSNEGDVIRVSSGTYYENVVVNKTVSLIGEDKETTIIDGNNTETAVHVKADNLSISRFTIRKSGCGCAGKSGIYVESYHQNVNVTNNLIIQNGYGIKLDHAYNITIAGNNITNNAYDAVSLSWSFYNTIFGNNIKNNKYGIKLYESSNNSIFRNDLANNTWIGISSYGSSSNSIAENSIANSSTGIWLGFSSNNIISGNNLTANVEYGVYLESSSSNSILRNNMANNEHSIFLALSSNNIIYHNNFVNNKRHHTYSTNVWDGGYPSGGNYWNDYNGTDYYNGPYQNVTGKDGIGDTAYTIDENGTDRYPLMAPIGVFDAGIWNGVNYYVDVVSNSTVSDFYFSENDTLVSFNVTGLDGTVGFCRVAIPKELLWCEDIFDWTVRVNNMSVSFIVQENGDYTYIYFTYSHSVQNVKIIGTEAIPEFPTWTAIPLIFIVLTVAIVINKRRLFKTPIH